jgi:radical SAM protein with 4Fe4S-binding SPASM domain
MKEFTIQIFVTNECNLKCKYCYINQNNEYLLPQQIDLFYNYLNDILNLYGFENYSITYFGGEPLLNWDIIKYSHEKYFKNDKKCLYEIIITNGILLNGEIVKYIKQENLKVSYSFDGIWQNINRPLKIKNNLTSYDLLFNNKKYFDELNIFPHIMIQPNNCNSLIDNFYFFINEWKLDFIDFTFVEDGWLWNNKNIKNCEDNLIKLRLEYEKLIKENKNINITLFTIPILEYIRFKKVNKKRNIVCFSGHDGIALGLDNKIYPCVRFATNKKYSLIDLEKLKFNKNIIKFIYKQQERKSLQFKNCEKCIIGNYCKTGCQYNHLTEKNFINENLCKLFKIQYKEALILFKKFPEYFIKMYENSIRRKK